MSRHLRVHADVLYLEVRFYFVNLGVICFSRLQIQSRLNSTNFVSKSLSHSIICLRKVSQNYWSNDCEVAIMDSNAHPPVTISRFIIVIGKFVAICIRKVSDLNYDVFEWTSKQECTTLIPITLTVQNSVNLSCWEIRTKILSKFNR